MIDSSCLQLHDILVDQPTEMYQAYRLIEPDKSIYQSLSIGQRIYVETNFLIFVYSYPILYVSSQVKTHSCRNGRPQISSSFLYQLRMLSR